MRNIFGGGGILHVFIWLEEYTGLMQMLKNNVIRKYVDVR
jgi:hypothetical protein